MVTSGKTTFVQYPLQIGLPTLEQSRQNWLSLSNHVPKKKKNKTKTKAKKGGSKNGTFCSEKKKQQKTRTYVGLPHKDCEKTMFHHIFHDRRDWVRLMCNWGLREVIVTVP